MALQKTSATLTAYKLETTFKTAVTFADADVVPYNTASWKPETDEITRNNVSSRTLLAGAPMQGKSTATGTHNMEVLPDATASTKLVGSVLYEATLGEYHPLNGAQIDLTNKTIVDKTGDSLGDAGLYYLSTGNIASKSLSAKYVIGGDEANSVDVRGVLVNSMKMTFPTQGIVTAEFGMGGSTGFIPVNQGTPLTDFCSSMTPHVARGMTVTIDGVAICATDLEFTVTNEVADFVCVTDTGVGQKSVTKRTITGSFKIAFEDLTQVSAYNAWSSASLFAYSATLDGKLLAIELANMQRTSLDLADDNGIFTQTVTFTAVDDCSGTGMPIKIAVK